MFWGTHVLLEAAKQLENQLKRFIHVSTDEVYGESKGSQSFSEENVLEPTNPYAATKAAAELLAKAYHRSFDLPVIITRSNNVYGPRQYPEKVIPKFINQAMLGMKLTIHGNGSARRNLVHVSDVSGAFLTILSSGQPGQIINVGGNCELSVLEIATKILNIFGKTTRDNIEFVDDRPFNDTHYNIDMQKLRSLGWEPKVDFSQGLEDTVKWYKRNPDNWGYIEDVLVAHPSRCGDKLL